MTLYRPVRLVGYHLKGEQAEWVDQKLDEEVKRGQCVRGNSAWGSPAFPTKEFAEHRRQRKRRIVVDYRRVNARTLRAVYMYGDRMMSKQKLQGASF